jgi:hypothetical protein
MSTYIFHENELKPAHVKGYVKSFAQGSAVFSVQSAICGEVYTVGDLLKNAFILELSLLDPFGLFLFFQVLKMVCSAWEPLYSDPQSANVTPSSAKLTVVIVSPFIHSFINGSTAFLKSRPLFQFRNPIHNR